MGALDNIRNKFDGTTGLDETSAFDKCTDFLVDFVKAAADGMASTTTAATKFWCNAFDFNVSVISGKISPGSTLTASDTDNAQIMVQVDNAADGAPATALLWTTTTTGTGSWATDIAENHNTRTSDNCTVIPGANLFYAIAKTGSGVVVPVFTGLVRLRRIGG